MGLFEKLKNVLFEEEEVEIPDLTKSEYKQRETQVVNKPVRKYEIEDDEDEEEEYIPEYSVKNVKRDIVPEIEKEEVTSYVPPKEEKVVEPPKEEKVSPFLPFDEDEFERFNPKPKEVVREVVRPVSRPVSKPRPTTVDRRIDDFDLELPKPKPAPVMKFRPSPVISPVYGILDKNYKKEDIIEKTDDFNLLNEIENAIDVDSVRNKAYGNTEEVAPVEVKKEVVKEDLLKMDEKRFDELLNDSVDEVIEEPKEEVVITEEIKDIIQDTEEKVVVDEIVPQTIDTEEELPTFEELMEQQTDVSLDEEVEDEEENDDFESTQDLLEKTNTLKILDDIEKELNNTIEESKSKDIDLEDTRETDLFNLIDSMYENVEEEGE